MGERILKLRDNKGTTIDRYTFIIFEGNIEYYYSFSENPYGTFGINHYCGSNIDGLTDGLHLGEVTEFVQIPALVRQAIFERYNENREKLILEMKAKILKFENTPLNDRTKKDCEKYQDLIDALYDILSA